MMTFRRPLLCVLTAAIVLPPPAVAHGPCDCLKPSRAHSGERVRVSGPARGGSIGYPAYRILFNPRPRDLGIAPRRLAREYQPDAPTLTLLERPRTRPTRKAYFRVPQVPAGRYLVLIWDGEEGGAHNTWERLEVHGQSADDKPAPRRQHGVRSDDGGLTPLLTAAIATALVGALAVAGLRRKSGRS